MRGASLSSIAFSDTSNTARSDVTVPHVSSVTIRAEDWAKVTETDRKYMNAIEAAGIAATLTGEPGTLDAATLQAILHVVATTPGLSTREFLIDVVLESPALGFDGVTDQAHDDAAAVLLATAQMARAAAEISGNDTDAATLGCLVENLVDKSSGRAEIP